MYRIYLITEKCSGKSYVGLTKRNINRRFYEHMYGGQNGSRLLHEDVVSKGKENFSVSCLKETDNLAHAIQEEKKSIIQQNSLYPNGYNIRLDGPDSQFFINDLSGKQFNLFK